MRFSYVALNKSNQKLKGFISGNDRDEAKRKLHDIGLTVLEIVETSEDQSTENIQQISSNTPTLPSFEFHVVDPDGRKLAGTIQAPDRKNAFRRLVSEYSFIVMSLAETTIPKEERITKGTEGLEELAQEVEEEFGIKVQKIQDTKSKDPEDMTQEILGTAFLEEKKIMNDEINEVTEKTKNILKKYTEKIPAEKIDEMEVLMGNLIRLKRSNNIQLIQKVSDDLCNHLEGVLDEYVILAPVEEKEKDIPEEQGTEEKKSILGGSVSHLKKVSTSLDMLLSGKRLVRKKKVVASQESEKIKAFMEQERTVSKSWKGFWYSFFKSLSSSSAIIRHQRMEEVKYFFHEWIFLLDTKYGKYFRKKASPPKNADAPQEDRKSDILSLFFSEFQAFFGMLLLFFTLYFLFAEIVLLRDIEFFLPLVRKSMQSETMLFFFSLTFLGYFISTIREKFFIGAPFKTTLYLLFMGLFSLTYFINF